MKIIAGLGNPGPKYETTRHNVGFLALDRLVDFFNAQGPVLRHGAQLFEAQFGSEKILLVKPQGFMNLSGRSIGPLVRFYQCVAGDLIVIHDDVDLDPLSIRLKTGGGSGGHNGLKSIDEALGKGLLDYHRVRVGVGHPSRIPGERRDTADYVLGQFTDSELGALDKTLDDVVRATEAILSGNMALAMNQLHQKPKKL